MKGIKLDQIGGEFKLTDDLAKPTPAPHQLLVKSIYGAVNPVDELMRTTGLLITDWPWTPCCDIGGIVVEVGSEVTNFKVGDQVFGYQGLGFPGSGGAAEYCLVSADMTFKKPDNITLAEGATLGVGYMASFANPKSNFDIAQTAALGLWDGLNIDIPDPQNLPAVSDEWVFVTGGGGSVGAATVQVAVANGADETVDYKAPVEEQVEKIKAVTKGRLHRLFDSTPFSIGLIKAILESIKDEPGQKYFAAVNDWEDPRPLPGDANFYPISLGPAGRPDAVELNAKVAKYTAVVETLITAGKVKPGEYNLVGGTGFETFIEAIEVQKAGSGKKVIVKFQDE
ncbi:Zeta-crystallin [Arthrobotrys entomopaga]|nr:Zeta-crystallin [Arthrobotrys entomopaga]